ncbi:hypothetical protein LTR95_014958 [Oleoguttula sp. CCFEE 5521]
MPASILTPVGITLAELSSISSSSSSDLTSNGSASTSIASKTTNPVSTPILTPSDPVSSSSVITFTSNLSDSSVSAPAPTSAPSPSDSAATAPASTSTTSRPTSSTVGPEPISSITGSATSSPSFTPAQNVTSTASTLVSAPSALQTSTLRPATTLSTGAKVGIGIAAGVIAISLLAGMFFWFVRRRRRPTETELSQAKPLEYDDKIVKQSELDSRDVYELVEQRRTLEIGSKSSHWYKRHELAG